MADHKEGLYQGAIRTLSGIPLFAALIATPHGHAEVKQPFKGGVFFPDINISGFTMRTFPGKERFGFFPFLR
ncbi:MAG: hypothetical protein PHC61_16025 [Chitinivibrionales bacterium]|nr:hypothetical protein [Chitinivibrionales bacterium]